MPRRPYTASPAARCAASRALRDLAPVARRRPPATGLAVTDTAAARAAIVVARRLVSRPARARALARLARPRCPRPRPPESHRPHQRAAGFIGVGMWMTRRGSGWDDCRANLCRRALALSKLEWTVLAVT